MSFDELGLEPGFLRAIAAQGYTRPTAIQKRAIPAVLGGRDVLAGAQTGTGKTAAFAIPIMQRLGTRRDKAPRVLVLTPTRELAQQVCVSFETYGDGSGLRNLAVFGGVGIEPQKRALNRGVDIVVATPGRLLDHVEQRTIDLTGIEVLVLDEADRMLDMGFIGDIRKILKLLPGERQNLMFSATYSDDITALANSFLVRPEVVQVTPPSSTAKRVRQYQYRVEKSHKRHLLAHLIEAQDWYQALVFTRTKHGADRLARQLDRGGIEAAAIHGNKSQNARTRALDAFKTGRLRVLVATDIAARGLDIDGLPYVVNFELPNVPEDYVHRIGRTGRAGAEGEAVSLVSGDESGLLKGIQKLLGKDIERRAAPDFVAPDRPRAQGANAAEGNGKTAQQHPAKRGGGEKPAAHKPGKKRRRRRRRDTQSATA